MAEVLRWLVAFVSTLLTLTSVERIDGYPLYTMHTYGDMERNIAVIEAMGRFFESAMFDVPAAPAGEQPAWACSLFAALADPDAALYGRNFDWQFSPAVLLFNHPPDGYDSVAMVDIAYLGFGHDDVSAMSLAGRAPLVYAPGLPFDGMNEHGLAIGMAAVAGTRMPRDPDLPTVGSLGIMREVLDHARTVDEAIAIFGRYNIDMAGGPPVHYLIADAAGGSVLIEFHDGAMVVQPGAGQWDVATNFIRASTTRPDSMCWRYRTINTRLTEREGRLTPAGALELLEAVSQANTQWSVVYDMAARDVNVVMGRDYTTVYHLPFHVSD